MFSDLFDDTIRIIKRCEPEVKVKVGNKKDNNK